MAFVGIDEDAEAVWIEAVFDTGIAEKEREDLMEDLNEEGLSDPKRPSPQDYALITNRIALIDRLTPDADKFVLRHLQEARKDLVNLAAIIQGQGQPVR
jgi:hypothetical protein